MLEGDYLCQTCRIMFDHEPVLCTVCNEEEFCSKACMWNNASICAEYQSQKQDAQIFTTRSVLNNVFTAIRMDQDAMNRLESKLGPEKRDKMLLFYTPDLQMVCDLFSKNPNWKETLLNGVEVVKSIQRDHAGRSFVLAFHCTKTNKTEHRLL